MSSTKVRVKYQHKVYLEMSESSVELQIIFFVVKFSQSFTQINLDFLIFKAIINYSALSL